MFVIDTNVISELQKIQRGKADPRVSRWVSAVDLTAMFLSTMTIYEPEYGALLLERRDPSQGRALRRWLDGPLLENFASRVLAVDATIARRCAALNVPNLCSFRDALVAATALVHDMTVVTRNVRDFERTGVALVNPWDV
jgi:predicted nucleic acid-binding protein